MLSSSMTIKQSNFMLSENSLDYWQYINTKLVLVTTLTLLTAVWFFMRFKEFYRQRARMIYLAAKLPGPPTVPLFGNALLFACSPDKTLDRIIEVATFNDTIVRFWLGPKLCIAVTEPRDYEVILQSQQASYKDSLYRFMEPFVGKGLVSGSGPVHRSHRRVILPMLNSKALNMYLEYFNSNSQICTQLLEDKVDSAEFDIQPFLSHCTFDMIFDTILGMPGNAQKDGPKDLVYWTETMYEVVHTRMVRAWLHPDWIFSLTNLFKKQKSGQQIIHGIIESAVTRKKKEHFALQRGVITSDRPRLMLIEQLIDHVMKTNLMDDNELRDEVYTIFTAAQDTTAVISSFALLNLAMNQDIQDKVRKEIQDVVGNDNVKVEYLSELKYTEMVIKETLRLYPIAPLMARQITEDIQLESCTIPKGCSVFMVPFITHRSPRYWTDPEKFIPERFLPEHSKDRHPYAFVPFSGGLRGCIGQKYAMMCLKTMIVHIIRKYRLTSTQKLETLRLKTDISIRSRDKYMVSLSRV